MARSLRDRGALKAAASSTAAQQLARAYENGVLLAHTYEKEKPPPNPKGWWVSEKLDGVRAYWNGEDFYSRNGQRFHAPAFFKEGLPTDTHLDGELWLAREQFEKCVGTVRTTDPNRAEEWRVLTYLMFDAPVIDGRVDVEFEARQAHCEKVAAAAPFASAVAIRRCEGKAHMDTLLKGVLAHGGEGLMLRKPRSLYERTRSHSLLKVKTFLDAEARVIGHSADTKIDGAMGALECEMPLTGVTFKVGSGLKMAERATMAAGRRNWPIGTVISYKYQGLTAANSKPRFPTYLRIRSDKTWAEVVADAQADADRTASEAGMLPIVRAPSLMAAAPAATSSGGGGGSSGGGEVATSSEAATAMLPVAAAAPVAAAGPVAAVAPAPAAGKRKREGDNSSSQRSRFAASAQCEPGAAPIQVKVGQQWLPPKPVQLAQLAKWAAGEGFDSEYLHLDGAGAPEYFEAMDGRKMWLRLAA